MSDIIDRQAAIDEWKIDFKGYVNALDIPRDDYKGIMAYIDEVPSAQPEPCEDAVSRADVVDMLEMYPFVEYSEYETAREVVRRLPSVQPEQRWIPVTERLPEAGIRYQVTFESGEVGYADFRNKIFFYDGSAKENVWEIERYYKDEGEVIAWMPLPEPYREETEDE